MCCGPPVDAPGPEAREAQDRVQLAAVGAHPIERVTAVILEPECDPLAIGRVRAGIGPEVGALVVRQVAKVCPVGADGGYVGCFVEVVGIVGEDEVLAIGRPVLLERDVERERGELVEIVAIDVSREERLAEVFSIEANEAKLLPSGETLGSVTPPGPRIRRWSLPSTFMLQMASSLVSGMYRSKTTRWPSGVNEGWPAND